MKKDKNVAVSSSIGPSPYGSGGEEERERYGGEASSVGRRSSFSTLSLSPRNTSSKYDFVKVKVWLGDNCDHYYVLSRFLLSRMLTVTKIPNHIAVKIALELKKLLIDYSLLDVSQSDLEATLFKLMTRRGFGEEYISRYNMMTRLDFFERPGLQLPATTRTLVHTFHHQRVPLVILVCGTACSGKSTLATQLAQRLNLPNVLQTEMVYELLRTSTDAPLASAPVWARDFSSSEELITEFCRECRIVRKGLAGDLKKAMKDGKPIIIEGVHLDPSIYLLDDETKLSSKFPTKNIEAKSLPVTSENTSSVQSEVNPQNVSNNNHSDIGNNCTTQASWDGVSADDQMNQLSLEAINLEGSASENTGGTVKALEKDKTTSAVKEKSGLQPVVVPMVIKMAEFDHKALLEEWISTRTFSDKGLIQDKDRLMSNLRIIQDYLCSFKSQGLTVVNVSATTFAQTLDWMHSHLLQCIEQGIAPVI